LRLLPAFQRRTEADRDAVARQQAGDVPGRKEPAEQARRRAKERAIGIEAPDFRDAIASPQPGIDHPRRYPAFPDDEDGGVRHLAFLHAIRPRAGSSVGGSEAR